MKIKFFKIAIALIVILTSLYLLNKTILVGDKEKIPLIIKVIDNKTGIPLAGINVIISEERTPFKIPFPGTIMKGYHIVYNVESDALGEAEFVLKKNKKYIIEFHDKLNHNYKSVDFNAANLKNDRITFEQEM